MSAFGDQLRKAREDRGLSLEAAADATRIVVRHLEALERSDVEALPAGPFAKGYIEAYAQFLDIDPEPILAAYRAEGHRRGLDVPETRDRVFEEFSQIMEQRAQPAGRLGRLPVASKGLAWTLVAVGLLGLGGWLLIRAPKPDVTAPHVPPGEAAPRDRAAPVDTPREARLPSGNETEALPAAETIAPGVPVPEPAPPAVPRTTPEPPVAPTPPADLQVTHSGVGTGVEDHRLVGGADRFTEGSSVVYWTRVLGGRPGDVVHHVWFHEGQAVARAVLPLGGSHWRTYSRRVLPVGATGRWSVEARGPDGDLLARQEFLCVSRER